MPAILVASKMKSGLPKPVHSALPIPQLQNNARSRTSITHRASHLRHSPLKAPHQQGERRGEETTTPTKRLSTTGSDDQEDPQIYTDWANHYLVKSGRQRLIKDLQQDVTDGVLLAEIIQVVGKDLQQDVTDGVLLAEIIQVVGKDLQQDVTDGVLLAEIIQVVGKDLQQDVTDGVLLAEIIQVVANEKIEDINGYPKSRTQMIENIDTCLGFLAARGVNIQGLCAEEIRNGNLKTILGLFFSLSRYKQQQPQQKVLKQQASHQPKHSSQPGHTPHRSPAPSHTHNTHSSTASEHKAASDMLSSLSTKASTTQSKGLKLSVAQRKSSRLPGPTTRVLAPGSEGKLRGASNSNRRSQSFNHHDMPKSSSSDRERSTTASPIMTEHGLSPGPINGCSSSSNPQPNAGNSSKPWRSKPLNTKHSATSSMLSVKQDPPTRQPAATPLEVLPKVIAQKSMLEKFKLFNSKGGSKATGVLTERPTGQETESMESRPTSSDHLEEAEGNSRPPSVMATSPKLALKGIAQRTFGRALTPQKSSLKTGEKEKDKARPKERDKAWEGGSKRGFITEQEEPRDDTRQEGVGSDSAEPKRNTKSTSLIPKGGKAGSGKKEVSAPAAHSGIQKPGFKAGKTSGVPSSGRDGDRPSSLRAGGGGGHSVHKCQLDSRSSSSCSSLASSEGRSHHQHHNTNGAPPVATTASNTISVQLPHPQQQYNHPNTATVAPFMYRSQPDVTGADMMMEAAGSLEGHRETAAISKSADNSQEDLTAVSGGLSLTDPRPLLLGEDPEARRLRTVKDIADLRQNLEETMSSLRGTQISHSTLETTFDISVTTEISGRGMLNLSPRPNPALPWRLCPSSPRLQAGDAPSVGNGYAVVMRGSSSGMVSPEDGRYLRSRQTPGQESNTVCDLSDKMEELEGVAIETTGYMSDGDVLGKNIHMDKVTSGYMTDGGVGMYTRRLNRLPDGMAVVRETLHHNSSKGQRDATDSWDDSSSVSSGVSDTIDTDDINTSSSVSSYINTSSSVSSYINTSSSVSSYINTSSSVSSYINTSSSVSSYVNTPSVSCKDIEGQLQTDAEKHLAIEQNSVWSGSDEVKRSDGVSDNWVKMESGSKYCRHPSDMSDESDRSSSGRNTPSVAHTGSWRRGMSAQMGVTSPRTKAPITPSCATLKTHVTGKTDDAKVSEKGQHYLSPRAKCSMQRSPSDTGRSSGDEAKKPPSSSSSSRTPTTNTFGFKKHAGGGMTMVTASGVTITSGSATLGKIPKSVQLHGGRVLGRQASVDDGYLSVSSHSTLQYRSLPRPSRASGGGRSTSRSSSTSIDSNLSSKSNTLHGPKSRSQVPKPSAGGTPLPGSGSNQTDREKGVSSEASPTALGVRQPGGKYPDVSSPTMRRLFGGKQGKQHAPVTTAENMNNSTVISNLHANSGQQGGALDSPSASSGGSSPLYGGGGRLGVEAHSLSPLASSPSSTLSTPSHSLAWNSTLSRDTLSPGYPSLSSLATSSESIDLSLGSGGHGHHGPGHDTLPACVRNNGIKTGFSDSPLSSPLGSPSRNTLPRKQDRYGHLPQLRSHDDHRDWLRSHSAGGLQESAANSPFYPTSSLTSPSGARFNFSQLAGSPTTVAQINLANLRSGLANQDGLCDPHSDPRLRNSSMSLEEKSRTMTSSGSFREGLEEVHASSVSLVSSTSSVYSTPEEKAQSEIRKLRRELDASQEKVSALTTQMSANAHLVAAFEQSLGNMTIRLQGLTTTAEQKDSELNELRKTIEHLKKQNTAAQAAINGDINLPETSCNGDGSASANESSQSHLDLRIHRQHSSDSVSSITSATSHSSVGSNQELDSKKKKNWVYELRSSFKQAFGKKKSPKSASSHSDIEEMTDCSLPSSPKLAAYNCSTPSTPMLQNSHSNSLISEYTDSEAEKVMGLRSELRDKEMKLTDIRLEALSSAHQLDQLRESMNRMQGEIERLKTENDCLKMESQGSCSRAASQALVASPSAGQSKHGLALTESTSLDMLLEDSGDGSSRKEGQHVKVVVTLDEDTKWKEDRRPRHFLIGCIGVSGKTKWDVLDGVVRRLFKEYIIHVDPVSQLGLNSDCVLGYSIGDIHRTSGADTPELLPCGYLVGDSDTISVSLKGVCEHSQDSLVFETLIPKPLLQRYVSQLHDHGRIILSGPSGTGKSFLASRLAEHMVLRERREVIDGTIATFNVDHKSSKELCQYLSNLADKCNSMSHGVNMPLVVILDNLHRSSSLGEVFNGLLSCKHHRCPYIIGTMNQATSTTPNLQLHHNFKWVLCANHTEPVKGFLGRFLRRRLMETEISSRQRNAELVKIIEWIPTVWHHLNRFLESHSSSDVTIGPRLFLSCPMDVEGSRVWFTDLWNYSIIPYMLEAVREGLQLYGRRATWEDPAQWVVESYPWAASPLQHQWTQLLKLRPVDVGFDGFSISKDGCPSKQLPQGDTNGDPLMNMLMKLKEAAHCSASTQSYDSDSNSNQDHHDNTVLDLSLECTL
uniref:neuron navigator 2-like isoform X4 n=1 Tax=Oncorhynchus gorbuscha TaxID=8017 RepID=UPI001EAF8088|nr:neuron navigator 2-like isoform X4 [Oncorhynchus gorbuscha]